MVRTARAVGSEPEKRSTAEILGILHKWGVHTLGQLAALNKEELRDRLGPEAVRLWERANGTASRPLKLVQPPETFDESFEFDHEIETALRNPHQLYETLARLTALVGNDRVGTPVLEETHRPDAFRMENFNWCEPHGHFAADTAASTEKQPAVRHRTALRRFRPPVNATIFISQDRHLQSDKVCGQIIDQIGPFLLSGNWWDEKTWARAEWDMQLEDGELIQAHEDSGTWKVDGIYD